MLSSAAHLKQLGVTQAHWHNIHQLQSLRSFTAASLAPKAVSKQAAEAAQQPQHVADDMLEAVAEAPMAAYIHLPFCKHKCFYCDFPVEAVGLNVDKTREWSKAVQLNSTPAQGSHAKQQ